MSELTAAIDWLPTLAHASQIDLTALHMDSPQLDGVNVWHTLLGTAGQPHPRQDLLIWHGWGTPQAIRMGQWKLYLDRVKEISGSDAGPVLIHLVDDPEEQTNQSDQHPQRVQAMQALARKRLADIRTNTLPLGGPPVRAQKPKQPAWLP